MNAFFSSSIDNQKMFLQFLIIPILFNLDNNLHTQKRGKMYRYHPPDKRCIAKEPV